MGTAVAELAGWAGFIASALLMVGLLGLAVRYGAVLSGAGRVVLLVLSFATAITVGASSTLALVVPTLAEKTPELVSDPPAAVPPTFIFSGLVMGVCAIVIAVGLRRTGVVPGYLTTLLITGGVVTMVPLPSRFFLLAFAVGLLALAPHRSAAAVPEPPGVPATA